jgi:hypothetical protein
MRSPTYTSGSSRGYAELLQAHEHANATGQPLLTDAGISYVRQQLMPARVRPTGRGVSTPVPQDGALPYWDAQSRRLWLGAILLKEFRQPAPNQTRLLDVFQEKGWTIPHIEDPLSPAPGDTEQDIKRRLHDTIRNLNRGLPPGTIRFRGDGTGQGVRWEYDRAWRV